MSISNDELKLIATSIRTLSMDAIQEAKSGHPGIAMGCADIAAVLWGKILKHNPEDPSWPNRDRFVLSAGHGSMLLYSALHLAGYDITIEDIRNFRQLGSKTPGHPEHETTDGVETTTGPLGQGFANGIGMAFAGNFLEAEFNKGPEDLLDHYIYGIVSDGDIMEGLSAEAASLAGHMGLGNLIYIYDSNEITIEGSTDLTFSEDVSKRFDSCNWHVQTIDGHSFDEIEAAVLAAQKETDKPSIIIAKTTIAKGSANMEGSHDSHGAPLGDDEVYASKENIGCCGDDCFMVPDSVYDILKTRKNELKKEYDQWNETFKKEISGDTKKLWDSYFGTPDIEKLEEIIPTFETGTEIATRSASGKILESLFRELPNIIGGSADLGPSNKSFVKGYSETGKNRIGRNIHFGIREHAMGSIQNGIAYYGGFIPYTASFFSFMDYMRPAVRIAALGNLPTIYLFSHDSLFVGEDGPTHQPVEQLAAARTIPNLNVIRPADANETIYAWLEAIKRKDGPTIILLTRQNMPVIERNSDNNAKLVSKGAYIVKDYGTEPDVILLASGSEVSISLKASETLKENGITARVVSFPSWELFEKQPNQYKKTILSHGTPKVVVEAGISMGWEKYAGNHALLITMEEFGVSGPYKELAEKYGFTAENIVNKVTEYLKKK